ncbi:DUF4190 domain-containing protein [Luteolibacter ambystomatis]|uniref:DUF4190 domain-containing protein n=1 Tax=Luteolibacter ambystomatis TaxID=2824561 RepID=A0A975J115_9BACT|nr:DUF4190 domain-containing protein [Luteolibacter ambystomatis]QUE52057.1 DUF4190 domain-containing protein [Luteolibacter ambystomatis]
MNTPIPAALPARTSKAAIASLICGIGGLFTGPLTGIPAIITGHIAQKNIKRSGGTLGGGTVSMIGLVMGYATSVIVGTIALLVALAMPVLLKQQEKATSVMITSHMIQMVVLFEEFESDYGSFPSDALAGQIKEDTGLTAKNTLYQLEAAGITSDLKSLLRVSRNMKGDWHYFPGAKSTGPRRLVLISPAIGDKRYKALFSDASIEDFTPEQQQQAVLKSGPDTVMIPGKDLR